MSREKEERLSKLRMSVCLFIYLILAPMNSALTNRNSHFGLRPCPASFIPVIMSKERTNNHTLKKYNPNNLKQLPEFPPIANHKVIP